jgi:hypothetical protein
MNTDRRKLLIGIASGVVLIGAGWGGYALVSHSQTPFGNGCAYSTVFNLAVQGMGNIPERKTIEELDRSFVNQYTRVCADLCQKREMLLQRLGYVNAGDPESRKWLEEMTTDQAYLETLTWQHIISVRDLLPGAQRAAFIQAVQQQWSAGMVRMRHQVEACTLHPGAGMKMNTGGKK